MFVKSVNEKQKSFIVLGRDPLILNVTMKND
jgi:hypothetical protein